MQKCTTKADCHIYLRRLLSEFSTARVTVIIKSIYKIHSYYLTK